MLADRLRTEVLAICAQEAVCEHRKFCDGFTDAAGSICRNISEGFARFSSAMIVQFFGYAVASLAEVEDYLRECHQRRFIDAPRFDADQALLEHTRAKTLKFMRFHQQRVSRDRSQRRRRRST